VPDPCESVSAFDSIRPGEVSAASLVVYGGDIDLRLFRRLGLLQHWLRWLDDRDRELFLSGQLGFLWRLLPLVAAAPTAAPLTGLGNPHDLAGRPIEQHGVLGHVRHDSDDEEDEQQECAVPEHRRDGSAADAIGLLFEQEVHFPGAGGYVDREMPNGRS
jgi:hypothetical protein